MFSSALSRIPWGGLEIITEFSTDPKFWKELTDSSILPPCSKQLVLSLVALMQNQVVGHILFTPVIVESEDNIVKGMALAPMAVLPEYQRQGIGSELIRTGIEKLKMRQCPFIIVLGHAEYYPRFGFEPASHYGIRSEWEAPDDAFMILVIGEFEMRGGVALAKYRPEFAESM